MRAHLDLQGGRPAGTMLPIHWGTFNLAPHPWAEPGEGTLEAGARAGAAIALPRPGEPFEPNTEGVPAAPWWRAVARVPAGGWPTTATAVDTGRPPAAGSAAEPPGGRPTGTGEPEAVTSV